MKLICDLCGSVLPEESQDHAVCANCGMEYGPERLMELRAAASQAEPAAKLEIPAQTPVAEKKKSGVGIYIFLAIFGLLDIFIGTGGLVALFCLVIAGIIWLFRR